jgi:hypothetical protein
MAAGDSIYVQILEDEFGRIKPGADVTLVVDGGVVVSANFIPPSYDGMYYYKLGTLEEVDDTVKLVPYLMGSHIYHSTGLTADFRIMDCGLYGDPIQLMRLSFVSGKLHSVDESDTARALAPTLVEISLPDCSSLPESMP